MKKKKTTCPDSCRRNTLAIKDTQDLLGGKWKLSIVSAIYFNERIRFMELNRQLNGIAPKVLSKALKDLEANHLVKRNVNDTMPISVEYELTEQGKKLNNVIVAMREWGIGYRTAMAEMIK